MSQKIKNPFFSKKSKEKKDLRDKLRASGDAFVGPSSAKHSRPSFFKEKRDWRVEEEATRDRKLK